MNTRTCKLTLCCGIMTLLALVASVVSAQSVCLPAPRLLTTMPMGGQVGTEFPVTITGDYLEDVEALLFSDPRIEAIPQTNESGGVVTNQFLVRIADGTPAGIYESRVSTRLGVSSSRAFSVGLMPELVPAQDRVNTTLETARTIKVNSICNAVMSVRAIDHYAIHLTLGQRILVECCAGGIDSKLKPVLIVGDANGRDLVVQRRGKPLEFTAPNEGTFVVKVHDLTFQGGPYYFYRLAVREAVDSGTLEQLASTRSVGSFSWPPVGLMPATFSDAGNEESPDTSTISLPCDIVGSFYPAADVDSFEFSATQGEQWWVEVASERLGLPTDPSVLVQFVVRDAAGEQLTDIAELADIASPVKPSSNAYAYDGPPYNAGSSDVLGKFEVKDTGIHRLQIRDLFGGTRDDPNNVYRLMIRKAQPDFALVGWALHMELRNGDRNALSKPISLRGGATMALEVAVVRRDGFDGAIELVIGDLPEGVSGVGLTIPAGQTRGIMLLTAAESAPRGFTSAKFVGRAEIDGNMVERPCRLASMAWPVPDAWQEIPSPRLLADVPVSVSGDEMAPLSIAPVERKVWEVAQGATLNIPLKLTRRSEFSGESAKLNAFGFGFERTPALDLPLNQDAAEVKLDLAQLKTPPGEYTVAFYGSAVAKYEHNPGAVVLAEAGLKRLEQSAKDAEAEVLRLSEINATASEEAKKLAQPAMDEAIQKHKAFLAQIEEAKKKLQSTTATASPKDIADIIVTEPITIRVLPAEKP